MVSRTLIMASLVASMFALVAVPASAGGSYGALAHSDSTGGFGWAVNLPSQSAANRSALSKCGGAGCSIVTEFWKTCAAYAVGQNGIWGWATDRNRDHVKHRAVRNCSTHGAGCKVSVWACTGH